MKKKEYIVWLFSLKRRENYFNNLTSAAIICQMLVNMRKSLESYLVGILSFLMYKILKLFLMCRCRAKGIE